MRNQGSNTVENSNAQTEAKGHIKMAISMVDDELKKKLNLNEDIPTETPEKSSEPIEGVTDKKNSKAPNIDD